LRLVATVPRSAWVTAESEVYMGINPMLFHWRHACTAAK
jgi:hypothetical protein